MVSPMIVLIRAEITDDGKFVRLGPGIEMPVASVEIATEVPPAPFEATVSAIMFFSDEAAREEFAEIFIDEPEIEMRDL